MLKIFPCSEKRPLTTNGLHDAAPHEEWLPEYEGHAEWGVPTGPENGFWVFDVDKKSHGLETLAALTLPETLVFETRNGGKHFYFSWPADADAADWLRNKAGFLPGIDVRGAGGYVIAYGEIDKALINPAPSWLLESMKKPAKKVGAPDSLGEVGEGGRNHFLTRHAGRMQKIGVLSMAALMEINEKKCNPPLDEEEVERIHRNGSRYEPESTPMDDALPETTYDKVSSLAKDYLDYISDDKQVIGEPTGIEGYDALLGGGLRPGEIMGVLAPAKTGKSTFTHKIIYEWVNRGVPVGYASRELRPAHEVVPNLLSMKFRTNALKTKLPPEQVIETLQSWPLYFAKGFGYFSLEDIGEWMRELKGMGVELFVFDHLIHFVNDENYEVISQFSRGIKKLVTELKVGCILVIQPKQVDIERKVTFRDIRGGAAVGQAVDSVTVLERMRDENGKLSNVTEVRLDIARHKLARTGSIFLQYDNDLMDYVEVEPEAEAEQVEPEPQSGPIRPVSGRPFDGVSVAGNMIKRLNLGR